MIGMEYRAWVRVPDIDVEGDDAAALLEVLDERFNELGPVLSGTRDGVDVVVATEGSTKAAAVMDLVAAVGESMIRAGLGDHYPTTIRIEPVDERDRELEPA